MFMIKLRWRAPAYVIAATMIISIIIYIVQEYFLQSNAFDHKRKILQPQHFCYPNQRSVHGEFESIAFFDDISQSNPQPKFGKSIFFVETSCGDEFRRIAFLTTR